MSKRTRSTKAEAKTIRAAAAYATSFNKGLEPAVEVSKTSLDLAKEGNTETLDYYKQALKELCMPGLFLFDLAGEAIGYAATIQRNLLDLAIEQCDAIIEATQQYSYDIGGAEASTAYLIRRSADRTIAASESVLDTSTT
jgi:hypothetical protein